jgi:high-affinity nickel-transport protein
VAASTGASGSAPRNPARAPVLSRREKLFMGALYTAIGAVTVLAFGAAFVYLPHHTPQDTSGGLLIFTGLGITAYVLGLRHGFDADHIAAIDNTTRKLLHEGQRPLTVGTWFSLGHSTIVAGLIVGLVLATNFLSGRIGVVPAFGAVLGALVSGTFLFLIGLVNVVIVVGIYRVFRGLRDHRWDESRLEAELAKRGFLARYFGRLFKIVKSPWQIYPIGVLFGLGFDTASEVAVITIAVWSSYQFQIPLWAVLLLPLLFASGMVLADTSDGFAMRYAYGWAFLKPIRKIYYNLTLTVISVLVAFAIGGVEVLQVLVLALHWNGPFWTWIAQLDFAKLGIGIVILFLGAWLVAMAIYRFKGYEKIPAVPRSDSASRDGAIGTSGP